MPWVWRPFLGPAWINNSGTKGKNKIVSTGKSVDKTFKQAPCPYDVQSPGPVTAEIKDDERARVDLSMATGNNRLVSCGERYRENIMKVFTGTRGPVKKSPVGNDTGNKAVAGEEKEPEKRGGCSEWNRPTEPESATCESTGDKPGINEGQLAVKESLEKSIHRQFHEVQPGVFQFKLPHRERCESRVVDKNVDPGVQIAGTSGAIPVSIQGFIFTGYTREGLPVYTMR